MPNRLADETSPYLQQHANNPVDWYPWGAEALERARSENKPILLSIGYAACHWCHVMEHESFEDEETAALMNRHFVSIKVDREERPDLDSIYMQAVQAMTGHGGWPMTVFLTPAGEPFYGGTYFPPEDRHGMPSFRRVLSAVADSYATRPESVAASAASVRRIYETAAPPSGSAITRETLDEVYAAVASQYDSRYGGFGHAPKFPPTMILEALLTRWARTGDDAALAMARDTFTRMARGGIYDQVGGGFARYSTDERWLVPHFEKMLYDNALLIRFGAHLWQATSDPEVQRVVEETITWLTDEMTSHAGGFYSSIDADSEGVEGKFYVWTAAELDALLGDDAQVVKRYWGVSASGNFEGANILNVPRDPAKVAADAGMSESALAQTVARARERLMQARSRRVRPMRDEKILASWNGLMLRAVAEAARIFDRAAWRALATSSGDFLWREMVRDGRVMRSHKDGATRIDGFLEDYASLALGFVALYQLTFERVWLDRARQLAQSIDSLFRDPGSHQLFDTASDAETLVTRPRDVTDNAMPSGNSLAAELMFMIAEYFGDEKMRDRGDEIIASVASALPRYPQAFGHLLAAIDMAANGAVEVALVGESARSVSAFERVLARRFVPSLVMARNVGEEDVVGIPLLEGRGAPDGAAAYVCRSYTCALPALDAAALEAELVSAIRA